MGSKISRADVLPAARMVSTTAHHARRLFQTVRMVSRHSYRLNRLVESLFGAWRPYIFVDKPVAIHEGPDRSGKQQRRLLLVSQELSLSGAPRLVADIAGIFARAGWHVTILSPVDGPFRPAMREHATVIIDPTVLTAGSPLLRRLAPVTDLAICNTTPTAGAVVALAGSVPTLWYLHEVSLLRERLAMEGLTKRALVAAKRVWAGSELSGSLARPWRPDVRIQPYGVRPLSRVAGAAATAGGKPPPPIRIAVFAAIEPRKGQDLAIAAIAALSATERAGIRITLYGRILEREFADGVLAAAEAIPEVTLGGELSSEEYAAAMAATDIVLVSSRDDTLPLVSLDALGGGRLLLCTPGTGTSAWLRDGESGFVAADTGAAAIAAMLSRALARRNDWPAITRAGREVFDSVFSEAAFVHTLLTTAETMSAEAIGGG